MQGAPEGDMYVGMRAAHEGDMYVGSIQGAHEGGV